MGAIIVLYNSFAGWYMHCGAVPRHSDVGRAYECFGVRRTNFLGEAYEF